MIRTSFRSIAPIVARSTRTIHSTAFTFAKGDSSSIDSYKLPSQTSINEWEFKYDFIPKTSEPKVPPLTKEAVKQDIAQEKAKSVEREMFAKESNSSVKVEANDSTVVHGGDVVGAEHVLREDVGSDPIDVSGPKSQPPKSKKSANHDQYVHSSVNPNINSSDVVNLSENEVDHKTEPVEKQSTVVEDIEHDNLTHQGEKLEKASGGSGGSAGFALLAIIGFGGAGYFYWDSKKTKEAK
ncbi:hypothetical protein Cantr_06961 [Candida viswanathii]|uniref:Uncharacterized protein n=1 Tax=Candida viswanathii TaxID=5486 RepID=A0A367XVJ0_9ASCO|nr:hypothetical protein Cantr_06961 [Candida viswanathii]